MLSIRRRTVLYAVAIAALAALPLWVRLRSATELSRQKSLRPIEAPPLVLAFMVGDPAAGLTALQNELAGAVDVVSPQWLQFDAAGKLVTRLGSEEFVAVAAAQGLYVWPLAAYAGPYGEQAGCPPVLCDADVRSSFVQRVVEWAAGLGVQGLVLDVEYASVAAAPHLVQLAGELAADLHRQDQQLWVAVFPAVGFPADLHRLHDTAALGEVVDGLILMAYDQHGPRTGPGPVADPQWVSANVADILEKAPPEKVLLGIPAYGYVWEKRGSGWRTRVLAVRDLEVDPASTPPAAGEAWWESTAQAAAKAEAAVAAGLRGVAVWRQGLAHPALWSALRQAFLSRPETAE
jgi:spore germination protein